MRVALALADDPSGQHWGYELSKQSGLRSGVLYPILHRMLHEGWLEDGWEDPSAIVGKRPPRRYYTLTEQGITELGGIIEGARSDARFVGLIARPA